ncbi:hypothetical protein [Pelagibius sp. Alg239-R121]|uniref:hypothetical protein n=1 Tax=Pelagibius sp. Alg239-R121 TaxID=2993448 RepID=UPI0024A6FAE3|nr:hypothetical protein [Pelagibius sp. Alg239-R121]
MSKSFFAGSLLAAGMMATAAIAPSQAAGDAQIIELTQTACQFVEVEGKDHGYSSNSKADCNEINDRTGDARLANSEILKLKPGKYIFRVKNENVPYALGFWVRGDGLLNRATLPSVSGGGLTTGTTKDYEITLKAGEYVFSCPLNPTPDYKLVVEG